MSVLHCILCLASISILQKPSISETPHEFVLKNRFMQVSISKTNGLISTIILGTQNILDGACSVFFEQEIDAVHQIVLSTTGPIQKEGFATISFVTECAKNIVIHRYIIDTIALRWEVTTKVNINRVKEYKLSFSLPIVKKFEKIFCYEHRSPLELKEIDEITLTYRADLFLPMITAYSLSRNYGLSIVAPFELPKPELQFVINKQNCVTSFHHLRPGSNNDVNAAIYVVPHGGDWRPCLDFVLKRYPEYFYPANPSKIRDGWYYLSYPDVNEESISAFSTRGVEWIEFTAFFPFYGLYIPRLPDWGIIFDSDEIGIGQWEAGIGTKRISLQRMKDFIQLWHKYGVQVFLYYQSAEAWHQYAEKYFENDIAVNRKGIPLPAWQLTNLMNPDPGGDWGRYIIDQAEKILQTFPEIDGIFYDRMDYCKFDFAHADGLTMIDSQPAYMLAFGQERINEILFDLYHKKGKAIWGNVPTSIEVCKDLDGIMAEKNLRYLLKLQYLGIVRPIIYLPYDDLPDENEEKLKNALVCGATISVTYGGKQVQNTESKYRPIFEILKNRTWVLNASCLMIPAGLQGNIFRTPDGNYVVVIVSPNKLQVKFHPFEYNIPITINIPDVEQITNAYYLSGDWQGIHEIKMNKENRELKIILPCHLATSTIYLTRKKKYELVCLSSPILIKGNSNKIVFSLNAANHQHDLELKTPWISKHKEITDDTIAFDIAVPAAANGESNVVVSLDGEDFLFTSWVVDPVSIVPQEDVFIHQKEGEDLLFYLSNNLHHPVTLNPKGNFVKGKGSIETPGTLYLAPLETRLMKIRIACTSSGGNAVLRARIDKENIAWPIMVNAVLAFSSDDLFHDDFADDMKKWKVLAGNWSTSSNTARGSGPAHFACVSGYGWQDYVFESTVRCQGSRDPAIDWLKSYIFFRVQDDKNYYRFGIQGDIGVLSLYKRVNGRWIALRTKPFIAKRNRWYTLRVQVIGTRITCFVDNKQVMALNDGTFGAGGIGIGVQEDAMQCDYKNTVVKKSD